MAEITEKPERNFRRQQYFVEKSQIAYDENPFVENKLKLDREEDKLQHLLNAEKGSVKERAKEKADLARKTMLNRVIQQV